MVTKTDNNKVTIIKEKKHENTDNSDNERNDHYNNSDDIAKVTIRQEYPIFILQ